MAREKAFIDKMVIIERAVSLIEREGYEAFSTRRLSAALGISVMTLYNYYDNREAILREATLVASDRVWGKLPDLLEPYFAGEFGSPLRAYLAFAEYLRSFMAENPRLYAFLFDANLFNLQRDEKLIARYASIFARTAPLVTDPGRLDELHRRIYLFEVLANSLVRNLSHQRSELTAERFRALVEDAYAALLAPYEPLVPAPTKRG